MRRTPPRRLSGAAKITCGVSCVIDLRLGLSARPRNLVGAGHVYTYFKHVVHPDDHLVVVAVVVVAVVVVLVVVAVVAVVVVLVVVVVVVEVQVLSLIHI